MRLQQAGDIWLERYVATTRNPKGQRLARTRFERYLAPRLGHVLLGRLTGDDVREFRLWLEKPGRLRPYTVTHVLSDLRCLLRWAVSSGLIERSPFPARVMPRIAEAVPSGFDQSELATLRALGGRVGFVVRFLLATGLRWAEACRAERSEVQGNLLVVANTKSGRVRRVPLSAEIHAEIRAQIAAAGTRIVPYSAKSPGSFSRIVRRRSAIAHFHVHRCRHTFAMRWLAAGGNLAVLQRILGHRDLSTTMRYARVTDELMEREAARIADRLK